jgi:hypothetical protein
MRRLTITLVLIMAFLALAAPASAHVIQITNPKSGATVSTHKGKAMEWVKEMGDYGWVGGGGAGHGTGLVDACHALGGHPVVFIGTTWNPHDSCTHSTPM